METTIACSYRCLILPMRPLSPRFCILLFSLSDPGPNNVMVLPWTLALSAFHPGWHLQHPIILLFSRYENVEPVRLPRNPYFPSQRPRKGVQSPRFALHFFSPTPHRPFRRVPTVKLATSHEDQCPSTQDSPRLILSFLLWGADVPLRDPAVTQRRSANSGVERATFFS